MTVFGRVLEWRVDRVRGVEAALLVVVPGRLARVCVGLHRSMQCLVVCRCGVVGECGRGAACVCACVVGWCVRSLLTVSEGVRV